MCWPLQSELQPYFRMRWLCHLVVGNERANIRFLAVRVDSVVTSFVNNTNQPTLDGALDVKRTKSIISDPVENNSSLT